MAGVVGLGGLGRASAHSAVATVTATGRSLPGIDVVALVNGTVYFRLPGGWADPATPLVSVQSPAVASVDVMRNMETREFPAGSSLYVGFGASVEDLLARSQLALVRRYSGSKGSQCVAIRYGHSVQRSTANVTYLHAGDKSFVANQQVSIGGALCR